MAKRKARKDKKETHLKEFFAVTSTSVYHVKGFTSAGVTATKIALRDQSRVSVGGKLTGPMMAIRSQLIAYIPEGGGITSYQRKIELVNTSWWTGNSSPIVALFKDKKSAMACNAQENLSPCDYRWLKETIGVLQLIGEDHPVFYISNSPDSRLLELDQWRKLQATAAAQ